MIALLLASLSLGCLTDDRGTAGKSTLLTQNPDGDTTDEGPNPGPGGGDTGEILTTDDDDADGDGYGYQNDCDDNDPRINPGVSSDECDGVDEDCDDIIDEDTPPDDYEIDDNADLGELTGESAKLTTFLTPEGDIDIYYFFLDDGVFSWFDLDLDLEVPNGIDMAIELYWFDDDYGEWILVEETDEGGDGRNESITYEGGAGSSDTGWYGVLLYGLYGGSCEDAYTLHIEG